MLEETLRYRRRPGASGRASGGEGLQQCVAEPVGHTGAVQGRVGQVGGRRSPRRCLHETGRVHPQPGQALTPGGHELREGSQLLGLGLPGGAPCLSGQVVQVALGGLCAGMAAPPLGGEVRGQLADLLIARGEPLHDLRRDTFDVEHHGAGRAATRTFPLHERHPDLAGELVQQKVLVHLARRDRRPVQGLAVDGEPLPVAGALDAVGQGDVGVQVRLAVAVVPVVIPRGDRAPHR